MPLTKIGKEGITGISNSSNATAFTIDSSENILIGKTVGGTATVGVEARGDGLLLSTRDGDTCSILRRNSDDGEILRFQRDGTTVGSVKTFSNQTQYITTSDGRLKENIKPISDGVQKLMAMNPVTYNWKATPDEPSEQGFIAQDMQDIAPEAVSLTDGQEMMGMDYGRITPIIVSALQDALQRISKLEQKISELENG